MVAILEKSEHNVDFHPIVDFIEASPLRFALTIKPIVYVSHIRQFWSTARIETTKEGTKILATVDGILSTITESSLRRNLKLQDEEGISYLPDAELFENLALMGYNISLNQKFTFQKGRIVPLFDTMMVPQGEGSGTPTEPHHTPSPKTQHTSFTTHSSPTLPPVTTIPIPTMSVKVRLALLTLALKRIKTGQTLLRPPPCPMIQHQGQHSEMVAKFEAQKLEINRLKARVKLLKDREGVVVERSRDDAPIKGRNLDEGEAAAERVIPTGSGSIPAAGPPAAEVPTGSDVVPTAGLFFATVNVVTPYIRRKGKETMVESETPKKKKIQEHIDIQMARQLEEEMERDA
nr:hypothetical protein [Tanacetum cinerariifolium]